MGGASSQLHDGAAGEGGLYKVGGLCPKCPEGSGSFRTEDARVLSRSHASQVHTELFLSYHKSCPECDQVQSS